MRQNPTPSPTSHPEPEFDAGVLAFAGTLRSFIRKRVSNPSDVEDLAQEVFLKVFRAKSALRQPEKLEAWLYQCARTAIIDYYRRRKQGEELSETMPEETEAMNEASIVLSRSLRRFLPTIPDEYRVPLTLAELKGAKVSEIAQSLGLTETAVKSRLSRARAMLREKLLRCCQFEYDGYGKVLDYKQKTASPCGCESVTEKNKSGLRKKMVRPHLTLRLATEKDFEAIIALLETSKLPSKDLDHGSVLNFVTAWTGDKIMGCAGIEVHQDLGLLRSVAVDAALQGLGIGTDLVARAEFLGKQLQLKGLYLLTNTAEAFFKARGYDRIPREQTPASIQASEEFSSLCPSSAQLMHKPLK